MVTPGTTIDDCRIVPFPKIVDPRGNLTVIESEQQVPFRIQRASWIYGVPAGGARAVQVAREVDEIAVALSGSFEVVVDDGRRQKVVNLSQADQGLLVPPLIRCTLQKFSTNAACLTLASRPHDPAAHPRAGDLPRAQGALPVSRLDHCAMIQLPNISAGDGNLTFVENGRQFPFDLERVFYVYDVPAGAARGAHAHKTLHEIMVCISGRLDVKLDDGFGERVVTLDGPSVGLHIPPMIWASQLNFAAGSVYLVLASAHYDANDYLRDYDVFRKAVRGEPAV